MQRYFARSKCNNEFILNEDDIYHIKKVMRMQNGDNIYVVYNETTYICELQNVSHNITVSIVKEEMKKDDFMPLVTLYVPVLKEQKMDFVLQKATELGVAEIVPVITERTLIKINDDNMDKKITRWTRICKEASEQSHRTTIPKIEKVVKISDIEAISNVNIVCSTSYKEKNVKYLLQTNKDCDTIGVVMGPEGGLTEKEEEALVKNGFERVTFGNRILRVETVPLFILSIINFEYME